MRVNEIFYSLQGEGVRAGTANVFVRFTACNLRCDGPKGTPDTENQPICDTEFASGRTLEEHEVVEECIETVTARARVQRVGVILTGGEPLLQVTPSLVALLKAAGFGPICCETNGTVDPEGLGLDWITLSPKVAEHAVKAKRCNEVKYVRHRGQGIPIPSVESQYYLISPAFTAEGLHPETLAWCIGLVKENPRWRLSLQTHKWMGVR